jgi:hypothetical protein
LALKNSAWLDDGDEELTSEKFVQAMWIEAIAVSSDGYCASGRIRNSAESFPASCLFLDRRDSQVGFKRHFRIALPSGRFARGKLNQQRSGTDQDAT